MSLESAEVKVNLGNKSQIAALTSPPFFDSHGALLFFAEDALWRLENKCLKKKIAGGGTRWVTTEGEKVPIEEIQFAERVWFGCEVEEGVFWCAREESPTALLRVDTKRGEVEAISVERPSVSQPRGPLLSVKGPDGPLVYFYEGRKLRATDTTSARMVRVKISGSLIYSLIHDSVPFITSNKPTPGIITKGSYHSVASLSHRICWATGMVDFVTRLVDLDTGDNVVLHSSRVHPLLAITSSIMLAVEVKGEDAWVVTIDWSLPPDLEFPKKLVKSEEARYLLPEERTTRLLQITGDFRGWSTCFKFDACSNQLLSYDSCRILCFSDVFKINTKTVSGGKYAIYPPPKPTDLSKLLLPECPLPYDLQLTHSASNTSWKVHYDVLRHHEHLKKKENINRLAKIIRNSPLPSHAIDDFLKFLYFVPLEKAEIPFMRLCHCIQLCNQLGLGPDYTNRLLYELRITIRALSGTPMVLIRNILTLWFTEKDPAPESIATYSNTSPLMSLLAEQCRIIVSESQIEDALRESDFGQNSASQAALLCYSLTSLISPTSSKELPQISTSSFAPFASWQPLKWDRLLLPPSRAHRHDKHSFMFTIQGRKYEGIMCNSLVLCPQWKWFERLCKAKNSEEVLTRHVVFPRTFTPSALLAILSACYGASAPSYRLATADMAVICLKSGEFQLSESPCFAHLIDRCSQSLRSAVHDGNCLEKLHEFWTAGFDLHLPLFVDTLEMVFKNKDNITLGRMSNLPLRLRILVEAYLDHNNRSDMKDFIALADALNESVATFEGSKTSSTASM